MNRTGKDIKLMCEGVLDFSPMDCEGVPESVDHFDWLPDQFDAIFCGVEYQMMVFQYGPCRISTPIETFEDTVNKLKHGDLVTIRIR